MQFTGAACLLVLLTGAVSATRNVAQHHPVIKKANVVHKALLGGKSTAKLGCKVGEPDCGAQLKMVMEVNSDLKASEDIEKKAETAEIEAQKLTEAAVEVESAKKEEQSEEAAETAVEEKLETAEKEVKNEDVEVREEKATLEAEQQTLKKTSAVNPEAAAIVMKDEEKLKDEVKEKEIGKEVKEEVVKTVKQEAIIQEMKAATSEAKVTAKVNLFKAEEKSVKRMEEQISPKKVYKVEVKIYKTQTKIVKAASKEPVDPKTATVAQLVEQAELPKIKLATEKIATAKIEAQETTVEQKKAEVKIKEVVEEAKVAKEVQVISKKFGSVEKLQEEIKKCQPCEIPQVAPLYIAPQVVLIKQAESNNKCLDAAQRNMKGGKVHIWSCMTTNKNQQWLYDPATGQIKPKYGICLDAAQRNQNGGLVHMWSCNVANKNQQWVYDDASGQIKSKFGKCLDASQRNQNGGKVLIWECNINNKNQKWKLMPI